MQLPRLLFGTLREHYLLLFGMASGCGLLFGFVGAWIGARLSRRDAARPELDALRHIPEIASALDALTLDVERLAEAHRFIAKTLAERTAAGSFGQSSPPARREIGQITPH